MSSFSSLQLIHWSATGQLFVHNGATVPLQYYYELSLYSLVYSPFLPFPCAAALALAAGLSFVVRSLQAGDEVTPDNEIMSALFMSRLVITGVGV